MDPEALRSVLGESDLFAGLDDAALTAISSSGHWRRFKPGATLFHQDDRPTHLHIMGSGVVKMSQIRPGGAQFTIRVMGPGDVIGCAAVFQQFPYPATACVVEESMVLSWGAARFLDLMKQYPVLAQNVLAIVGRRAHEVVMRLGDTTSKKVEQRLAAAILRMARQMGHEADGGIEISLSTTRRDLAEMTGATYFTVSRTLSAWKKDGIIDSDRRSVIVKASHRLFEIAEDLE